MLVDSVLEAPRQMVADELFFPTVHAKRRSEERAIKILALVDSAERGHFLIAVLPSPPTCGMPN